MPIVNHDDVAEVPWRPNYRKWDITVPGDGTTSSSMSYSVVGAGAGAPLHSHEADELITVLEGELEARLGDEVRQVGPNHTLIIPPGAPHGFTNRGPAEAKMLTYFPVPDPFNHTTYLEGTPPAGHS